MPDERLTERFYGTFEGKTYEEIAREQPEAYRVYRDTGECAGAEVERSEVVGERFRDAVLEAAAACPPIALLSSSRTAPLSRGASFLCWAWTPRTSTGCAAWTTATGRNWYPLASQPRRAQRAPDGAWHRTTSGLARISWGPKWPPGASFAPITQRFSSM